jgi:hypothetical protein
VIPDGRVSGEHAMVRHEPGGWWLYDLQSSNGTLVNGEETEGVRLKQNDRVALGESVTVTASTDTVTWTYVEGTTDNAYHHLMTDVKAVLFYPVVGVTAGSATIHPDPLPVTGGDVTFSNVNVTPGTRKLLVYGGLIDGSGNKTNCWSSGPQTIELRPGGNVVTVYLTEKLE